LPTASPVSPTSLFDKTIADSADQRRYPNPLRLPLAVVPSSLLKQGVAFGSFGVAWDTRKRVAVPFAVGDAGPRVGEGSPALARQVAGLPLVDTIDRKTRFAGQADGASVLWVFFGGAAEPYRHDKEAEVATNARAAFERWGGQARLDACLRSVPRP
jgi:hypothetical protein